MQEKLDSIYAIKAISFNTFLFRNLFKNLDFGEETYLKKERIHVKYIVSIQPMKSCTNEMK